MQHGFKPLPPFGAILHQFHQTNLKLQYAVHIHCGNNAYETAKYSLETNQFALCLPIDIKPFDFYWPVNGLNIIIDDGGDVSKDLLIDLADCCISNGAKVVWIHSTHYPEGLYFTS